MTRVPLDPHALRSTPPLDDARALCSALGLLVAPRATSRKTMIAWLWHQERTPSCSVHVARDGTIAVRCQACGKSGDALTLIAKARDLDLRLQFREVLLEAVRLTGGWVAPPRATPIPANAPPLSDEVFATAPR